MQFPQTALPQLDPKSLGKHLFLDRKLVGRPTPPNSQLFGDPSDPSDPDHPPGFDPPTCKELMERLS